MAPWHPGERGFEKDDAAIGKPVAGAAEAEFTPLRLVRKSHAPPQQTRRSAPRDPRKVMIVIKVGLKNLAQRQPDEAPRVQGITERHAADDKSPHK